jgi:hypothetical protein
MAAGGHRQAPRETGAGVGETRSDQAASGARRRAGMTAREQAAPRGVQRFLPGEALKGEANPGAAAARNKAASSDVPGNRREVEKT